MSGPRKQLHADQLFQVLDRLTKRRLRHVQPRSSAAKVKLFGNRNELGQ